MTIDETCLSVEKCIENNIPTKYNYNKSCIMMPYCDYTHSCVYLKVVGDKKYCSFFEINKIKPVKNN